MKTDDSSGDTRRSVARGGGAASPKLSIEWILYGKMALLGRRACFIQ